MQGKKRGLPCIEYVIQLKDNLTLIPTLNDEFVLVFKLGSAGCTRTKAGED